MIVLLLATLLREFTHLLNSVFEIEILFLFRAGELSTTGESDGEHSPLGAAREGRDMGSGHDGRASIARQDDVQRGVS